MDKAALEFQYQMALGFAGAVRRHSFTLRCMPMDTLRQTVVSSTYVLLPAVPVTEGEDAFGNRVLEGTILGDHDGFSVSVQGRVEASGDPEEAVPECPASPDDGMLYRYQTPATEPGPSIRGFVDSAPACDCNALEKAVGVMHRIHSILEYKKGVTGPDTTAEQTMAIGAGVCQDFAQAMVSVLRCMGIPCRYVVGFIAGEGESHAWVEVLHDGMWYGLDPTGDIPVGIKHIKVSHGRDPKDCRINRGVFFGACESSRQVHAAVAPVSEVRG